MRARASMVLFVCREWRRAVSWPLAVSREAERGGGERRKGERGGRKRNQESEKRKNYGKNKLETWSHVVRSISGTAVEG